MAVPVVGQDESGFSLGAKEEGPVTYVGEEDRAMQGEVEPDTPQERPEGREGPL